MENLSNLTFNDEVKRAIGIAQSLAKENSHAKFSPAHLLKALLHKDIGLAPFLETLDKDIYYLEEWADVRIESSPKAGKVKDEPVADEQVPPVMRAADDIRLKLSKDMIDPVCVLASLSTPGVGFSYEQLKTFTLTPQHILHAQIAR